MSECMLTRVCIKAATNCVYDNSPSIKFDRTVSRLHVKADVQTVEADVEPSADVEKIQTKTETNTGEDTSAGAFRAPRADSPDFVSVFIFV